MKGFLLAFAVAFSLAGSIAAADESAPAFKYEEGRAAARAYEQAVRKAVTEYAAAVHAARKEYVAALDAALKAAMERGDLEEANRLNAAKEAAAKELAASYVAAASLKQASASSEALPTLVGTWRYDNATGTTMTFLPNGTYIRSWDRNAKPGAWRHVEGRKFMIAGDVVELSTDWNSFPNPNPKGEGQMVRRIVPLSPASGRVPAQ